MKKLNLKLGGIKEMLSKEQMKKVVGGDGYGYDSSSGAGNYQCCGGYGSGNIGCSGCYYYSKTPYCSVGNLTKC